MDLLELNFTWYIVAFLITLLVLTIWKTSPKTFPNAIHPKISGWTDLCVFCSFLFLSFAASLRFPILFVRFLLSSFYLLLAPSIPSFI